MRDTKKYSFISNKLPFSRVILTSGLCRVTLAVSSRKHIFLKLEMNVMVALISLRDQYPTIWYQDIENL
jgi:hypothetical protein